MSNYSVKSPILLLCFNRTETTKILVDKLRQHCPKSIYISHDCPRESNTKDVEECSNVIESLKQDIDWECEIHWNTFDTNQGCRLAVSRGISWFFENEEYGIILEDDCIPNESFFRYCDELLEKYNNSPNIGMISGNNFVGEELFGNKSYCYSMVPLIWGWATWRRAWAFYDHQLDSFNARAFNQKLKSEYDLTLIERDFWIENIQNVKNNKVNTWDTIWLYSCWNNNLLTCIPKANLVKNIGFGDAATHTKGNNNPAASTDEMTFPVDSPDIMKRSAVHDGILFKGLFNIRWKNIIRRKIKRLFNLDY